MTVYEQVRQTFLDATDDLPDDVDVGLHAIEPLLQAWIIELAGRAK